MKRKLLAILIVVAVIASLAVGCSSGIFEVDGYRDYHQVVATVQYKQMSEPIYKGDVLVYYSQYAAMYMQYYGMTSEDVVDYFYQSLSKQKLQLLYAKDYIAKNDLGYTSDAEIAKLSNEDFLTVDERRYCIELANKTFEDSWQQIISDLEEEQAQNTGSDEEETEEPEEDEDLLEARPVREDDSSSDEYVDEGLTDASKLPDKFTDYVNDKISAEEDKDAQKNMQTALNELNKNLESTYKDYDYYLNSYYETRILEKYEEMLGDSLPEITDEEVQAHYTKLMNTQIGNYVDESAYSSALSSAGNVVYHTTNGYSQVRSILLKFSDDQTAALKNVQSLLEGNDAAIKKYRALLALGSDVASNEGLGIYENLCENGIKVNVSNPDYDADYECKDENCDHETVTVTEGSEGLKQIVEFKQDADTKEWGVVYNVSMCPSVAYLPDKIAALGTDGIIEQIYTSLGQVRAAVESKAITHVQGLYWMREVATAWLYIVGDDSGSVTADSNNNGLGYVVTPEGEESGYIDSFTEQARALIANGGGSYVRDVDGGATLNNFYVYGDNFIDSDTAVDASSAYAGIFVLVASYVPYDKTGWGSYTVTYDEETDTYGEAKIAAEAYVDGVLPMDYVITHAAELSDCVTVRQSIEDGLLAGKKAALYEKKVNDFGVANYGNITYNEKAYKSLWKGLD